MPHRRKDKTLLHPLFFPCGLQMCLYPPEQHPLTISGPRYTSRCRTRSAHPQQIPLSGFWDLFLIAHESPVSYLIVCFVLLRNSQWAIWQNHEYSKSNAASESICIIFRKSPLLRGNTVQDHLPQGRVGNCSKNGNPEKYLPSSCSASADSSSPRYICSNAKCIRIAW